SLKKTSTRFPSRSIARYRYTHRPLTFRYVWSSPPIPVNRLGSRRGTSPGLRFSCRVWRTHFMFVQLATFARAANLLLFKLTKALLAPALTDPDQDGEDQFH